MNRLHRTVLTGVAGVVALTALVGCTMLQDTFQIGEREFTYPTAAAARESGESFRFQGFLPDDAVDVRVLAQLDGDASVLRWTSPTPFASVHCTATEVSSQPELDADWVPDTLPTSGVACGIWTVVRDGDIHIAWPATERE